MSYFASSFYDSISLREYSNIIPWSKMGYTPTLNSTESDIWSKGGLYGNSGAFPASAVQMELVGSENSNDVGTIIRGSRTVPVTSTGGTTTTLIDTNAAFTSATAVVVGDMLILDPSGTVPEWGYITAVTATTLTCTGGFSSGGIGASRKYLVLDNSAHSGAQAVKIEYLDASYVQHTLIMPMNGTTAVPTLDDSGAALSSIYRINAMAMIGAGSGLKPSGNLQLQTISGGSVWQYMTAGFTRSRNLIYTIPANMTLYVMAWNVGWSDIGTGNFQSARIYTRANQEPSTLFNTGNIFFPYTEVMITNDEETINFSISTKLCQKTDIRVCGVALGTATGAATAILRGFLVS